MRCWVQHLINHVVVCRVVSSVMTRVPTLCRGIESRLYRVL